MKVYGFGEGILWKPPMKGPQHDRLGNMGPRLFHGVFLGYHRMSNSCRVVDDKGDMHKTRAMQRRPMDDR